MDRNSRTRVGIVLLIVIASVALNASGAYAVGDDSTVTVSINAWMGIDVGNITAWAKGLNANGDPTPATDGADPTWTGGTATDGWPSDGQSAFCNGAVGRAQITVSSNARCRLIVKTLPVEPGQQYPVLKNGAYSLPFESVLGWAEPATNIQPATARQWAPSHPGTDTSTWLYAKVQRSGLSDRHGTYSQTVTLEGWTL